MKQDNALTVLIVEDEQGMSSVLKMLLERKFSATVEIAEDCASAREKFSPGTFDIITLDYQLPDGDGLELLKEINEMDAPPPVIMVTGHGDEQTAVESFKLGASGYVVKDKRLSTLLPDAVEHALSEIKLKHAEEALRESEERFRTMADFTYDWEEWMAPDGTFVYVSPSCETITGYSPGEFMDDAGLFLKIAHPEDRENVESHILESMESDDAMPIEFRIVRKDGDERWIDHMCQSVRGEDGTFLGRRGSNRDITERKRAEEALKELEENLQEVFDTVPALIFYKDMENKFIKANRSLADSMGLTRDQMEGKSLYDIYPQEQAEANLRDDLEVIESGVPKMGIIEPMEIPEGTRWFKTDKIPYRDEEGNTVGIIGFSVDITERKRAEEALRESEGKLSAILKSALDNMSMMDSDHNIVWANEVAKRLFGEELVGRKCYAVYHGRDKPCDPCIVSRTFEDGKVHEHETEVIGADGARMVFWCTANVAAWDDGGRPELVVEVSRDITERKRGEEKLRKSERYFREVIDNTQDITIVMNPDWTVRYISPSVERILGYKPEEVIGEDGFSILHAEDITKAIEAFTGTVENPDTLFPVEIRVLHKDGTWKTHEAAGKNLFDDPYIQGFIINTRDVSEHKKMEEELGMINAELEGYAHTISHDLKGPLSAIMLGVDMLTDSLEGAGTGDARETSEIVAAIDRNARNAQRRINDLLALAESGQVSRETSFVDVREVVKEVLRERSHEIEEKNIEVDPSPDMGTITGNPVQIQQVFSNLIGNAIRHSDREDMVIRVSHLGDDDGGHRYLVRDNGPGIPEDIIDDVFLPFTRGKGGDTGIGLSIVEKIVKVYGGEIRAYNDNGACFEFTLRDLQ